MEAYMNEESEGQLPSFLNIESEVTQDSEFSMFRLALKGSPSRARKTDE